MAFLGQTYTTAELPQGNNNFEPIPAGNYNAQVAEADLVPTKDGSGQYIKMKLAILGPSHEGRVLFSNINIRNKSTQAETIGLQQLGDIARAIGLQAVSDTDQLVGATMQIKVAVKAATGDYAASNEVKGYKAIAGQASAPFAASFSPPPPPAAASSSPPWMKK
jgi:hypothetical protein